MMIKPEMSAKIMSVPKEKAIPLDFNTVNIVWFLNSTGIQALTPGIFALIDFTTFSMFAVRSTSTKKAEVLDAETLPKKRARSMVV